MRKETCSKSSVFKPYITCTISDRGKGGEMPFLRLVWAKYVWPMVYLKLLIYGITIAVVYRLTICFQPPTVLYSVWMVKLAKLVFKIAEGRSEPLLSCSLVDQLLYIYSCYMHSKLAMSCRQEKQQKNNNYQLQLS